MVVSVASADQQRRGENDLKWTILRCGLAAFSSFTWRLHRRMKAEEDRKLCEVDRALLDSAMSRMADESDEIGCTKKA
jgi:hypothetical protein